MNSPKIFLFEFDSRILTNSRISNCWFQGTPPNTAGVLHFSINRKIFHFSEVDEYYVVKVQTHYRNTNLNSSSLI